MNIFVLDEDPIKAARMMCDKHIPKMVVETAQMMASALRRHGATDDVMPLTKRGTPYKGGYHHHPCTVWAGDSRNNYLWLLHHGLALSAEYLKRFHQMHACHAPIYEMGELFNMIPAGGMTPFARAFNKETYPFLYDEEQYTAVEAYRAYYSLDKARFAEWNKGTPAPSWWDNKEMVIQ